MSIIGWSGQALNGIHRGMEQMQRAAEDIARIEPGNAGARSVDMTQPLVAQMEGARQVEASVKVLEADDRALGSMLDVRA